MAERRSLSSATRALATQLEAAEQWQQQMQREYDLAEERIIAANAQLAALKQAWELVKPQPRRRTKREKV